MARKSRSTWGSNKPARRKGYRTLRYWADLHDGRGYMRHTKTIAGSRRDGDEELARLRVMHSEDGPVPTVRDVYEMWYLPDIERRLSKGTLVNYKSAWKTKIEPRWADAPITDIKPLDVQEWLLTLTLSQANMSSKIMSSIMETAIKYEVADSNVFRRRYTMPDKVEKRDKGIYDLAQAVEIFRASRGSFCEAAIIFALFGSCRTGESLSPKAGEIVSCRASNGMDAAYLHIVRQVGLNGEISDSLKTAESSRCIVFVGEVARRIIEIRDERMSNGLTWMSDNLLGEAVTQQALNSEWRKIADKGCIAYHPFRNLRNSWRTFMSWELGIDDSKLEKLMGHKGVGVTAVHYDRPMSQMLIDSVAEAFARKGVLN